MTRGCPHGHRLQPRLQASMQPLVAAWATDINTDPGCGRTMDPDMVLGSSPGIQKLERAKVIHSFVSFQQRSDY